MSEGAATNKHARVPQPLGKGVEDDTWQPVLVSHATFIFGTSLALLAGLLIGITLGAQMGHARRMPGSRPVPAAIGAPPPTAQPGPPGALVAPGAAP